MSEAPKPDKLQQGLLSVFDHKTLEAILLRNLNKKFPDAEFVSYVIRVADEQRWTSDLISAGLKQNPQNMMLKEFALLDPLEAVISAPPDTSKAPGDEVERALRCLIQVLKQVEPSVLSGEMFAELNSYLTGLYKEYDEQTAATIRPVP
jgi:hypothetical protein